MADAAKIEDVMFSINKSCQNKKGVYAEYSCKEVSWDDVQRGEVGGALSCWGGNITDTRLWEKNGKRLFTVRSDNWNEKLGKVSADQVAILVGNDGRRDAGLQTISVETFLKEAGYYGSYAGLDGDQNLHDEKLDKDISIRFQTTFLPVEDKEKATLEFASDAYNYNTMSDDDPKNLLLLCTTQGTAVQQDGAGAKKIYHHAVDDDGVIHRHWLEAERSSHKVGGEQKETDAEKKDAVTRGKATSELIGLESMGSRFNVLMTIQIPLSQKKQPEMRGGGMLGGGIMMPQMAYCSMPAGGGIMFKNAMDSAELCCDESFEDDCMEMDPRMMRRNLVVGKSNAARVSKGSEVDTWSGLTVESPKRHEAEHLTITVVIYNTVAGGVPSLDDVMAAIDDMEKLYESCKWTGRLADDGASFMKKELTVKEMMDIKDKVTNQPHPDWEKKTPLNN